MDRKVFVLGCLLLVVFLATISSVAAQQPKKFVPIGFLALNSFSSISMRVEAFRQGLRELGYEEGQNIAIEFRTAEEKLDRISDLVTELMRLKVGVIVTGGPAITRAAKQRTSTLPIVMGFDNDPVAAGFVTSLARPGGNVTGLSTLSPELSGKKLELLKEIVPRLSRVAVVMNSNEPGNRQVLKEMELAARALSVQLQHLDALDSKDIESAFRAAAKGRAEALVALPSPILSAQRTQIANLALKSRLPAIYFRPDFVEDGGLMSYATSFDDLSRRAATYVDKILKGAKPADLPVEQPTKFELVINLKPAKQIGLTIPPNVLARANKVIR